MFFFHARSPSMSHAHGRIAIACWLLVASLSAAEPARVMDLDAFGRIARLSDPQIAPDGRSIALVVGRANLEENRYDDQLVRVDMASGATQPLTMSRRGVSRPRWSPSGDRLAFLALHGEPGQEPRAQIHVLPLSAGDARRVTDAPNGVQHFAWSPDGATLAYSTADTPASREGFERHNRSFEIGNESVLVQSAAQPTHLWLVAADASTPASRLTSGAWSLPATQPPGPPSNPFSWTPTGEAIAFSRVDTPHSGDRDSVRVDLLDVGTKAIRELTEGRSAWQPEISPDGRHIAFWGKRNVGFYGPTEIGVIELREGSTRALTHSIDRNITRALWMPDGRSLLVGANDDQRVSLWQQSLDGRVRRLDLGEVSPAASFWVDVAVGRGGAIAFVGSTPSRPQELYSMKDPRSAPRRLSSWNAGAAELSLGRVELVEWKSDGFDHNGILTFPPGFRADHKHPLVLVIHGGPISASLLSFSAQAQLFAAQGWLVFQPNYRGSDHLGESYQAAIRGDAGAGPGRDVMAGLAAVVARGSVDESRIAVSGWSYGGFMATWLLGKFPNTWRVGVVGAPVTDWLDNYALTDFNILFRHAMGGSPWTDAARLRSYIEQSPLTHAPSIRAPTLILQNIGDYRVTASQAFKLHRALRDNGVETQLVGYPLANHNATDPVHQRDVQRRWIEWIARHLR